MDLLLNILLLVVGFVLLIKGADIFVDGASSVAQNFRVPKMLIGLTIVAFGTSAPELAVSISALASGSSDMVLGNVMGSCILNILLILGLAATIRPILVKEDTVKKEIPLCLLISTLLAVLFLDVWLAGESINQITRLDGIVLLLFFSVFLFYLITLAKRDRNKATKKEEPPKYKLGKSFLFLILGMAGIILGSQMVVNNATSIAETIGVSERIIALTIVAFGTSLPELVTSIVAARRDEQDLAVGNIIGSNIFNICIVLGIPVVIFGGVAPSSFQLIDVGMLVASALVLFFFSMTTRKINRAEGVLMLLAFAGYYTVIMLQ